MRGEHDGHRLDNGVDAVDEAGTDQVPLAGRAFLDERQVLRIQKNERLPRLERREEGVEQRKLVALVLKPGAIELHEVPCAVLKALVHLYAPLLGVTAGEALPRGTPLYAWMLVPVHELPAYSVMVTLPLGGNPDTPLAVAVSETAVPRPGVVLGLTVVDMVASACWMAKGSHEPLVPEI